MKKDFWILTPKDLSDEDILKSFKKSVDDILKVDSKKEALEHKKQNGKCEDRDVARKRRVTIEIIE